MSAAQTGGDDSAVHKSAPASRLTASVPRSLVRSDSSFKPSASDSLGTQLTDTLDSQKPVREPDFWSTATLPKDGSITSPVSESVEGSLVDKRIEESPEAKLANKIYELKPGVKWVGGCDEGWKWPYSLNGNEHNYLEHELLARPIITQCTLGKVRDPEHLRFDISLVQQDDEYAGFGSLILWSTELSITILLSLKYYGMVDKASELAKLSLQDKNNVLVHRVTPSTAHAINSTQRGNLQNMLLKMTERCLLYAFIQAQEGLKSKGYKTPAGFVKRELDVIVEDSVQEE
ncbi:hypothetical protein QFC22_006466 [Naganishia vaughanmartiniae]|uniref:Uncharacterized protein n=1 Tax=Naganishia vaughanmartiniae TaxID=1424756 RepID=A0ACC2WIL3_9TREE|nr:hypothetical protein QFC22_006466 [Naganishia vaughanmartiniae]